MIFSIIGGLANTELMTGILMNGLITPPQLLLWKDQIQPHLDKVGFVYGFFNNDYAGFGIGTCNKFKKILGMPGESEEVLQGRLF